MNEVDEVRKLLHEINLWRKSADSTSEINLKNFGKITCVLDSMALGSKSESLSVSVKNDLLCRTMRLPSTLLPHDYLQNYFQHYAAALIADEEVGIT